MQAVLSSSLLRPSLGRDRKLNTNVGEIGASFDLDSRHEALQATLEHGGKTKGAHVQACQLPRLALFALGRSESRYHLLASPCSVIVRDAHAALSIPPSARLPVKGYKAAGQGTASTRTPTSFYDDDMEATFNDDPECPTGSRPCKISGEFFYVQPLFLQVS